MAATTDSPFKFPWSTQCYPLPFTIYTQAYTTSCPHTWGGKLGNEDPKLIALLLFCLLLYILGIIDGQTSDYEFILETTCTSLYRELFKFKLISTTLLISFLSFFPTISFAPPLPFIWTIIIDSMCHHSKTTHAGLFRWLTHREVNNRLTGWAFAHLVNYFTHPGN